MSATRNTLTAAITLAIALSIFASTMAWAQVRGGGGRPVTEDTNAATQCTGDQVLQGDGDCVDLPTTAADCGLGEVFVGDGAGGGVCFPVGVPWDDRFAENSSCPCDILGAISGPPPWEPPFQCVSTDTTSARSGTYGVLAPLGGPFTNQASLFQNKADIFGGCDPVGSGADCRTSCIILDDLGRTEIAHLDDAEIADCFLDVQAIVTVLEFSCSPPTFKTRP